MRFLTPTYAILLVVCTAVFIDLSLKNWEKPNRVIEHDIHHYYFYLPAVFIYDDIQVKKSDYRFSEDYYLFWNGPDENGNRVAKMTSGLSIMYAPFFFAAHLIATYTAYPQNGFSEPYKIFLLLSAIFYLFVGLDYLRKILKLYHFNERDISLTILLIGLGTNLLAYSSQSGTMPHVYGFCLFTGFIYNTIKWYASPSIKHLLWIGLLTGLISLVRPSNAVIVLFFIFYNISHFADIKARIRLYKKHFATLLFIIPLIFIVWMPQFWYWKVVSGDFWYYSYRDEGFFFLDPKIIEGLFSWRKGWLIYTPMMVFAIAGLFFMKRETKQAKTAIMVFSIINIYVIFSWWCWWYGGSYGQRAMIASYAVLAIPFAAFIKYINNHKGVYKIGFYGIAFFFVWLNIFQTYQYENDCLHYDSMSSKAYFKQFGIMHRKSNYYEILDPADYDEAKYRGRARVAKVKKSKKASSVKTVIKQKNGEEPIAERKVNIRAYNQHYLCTDWNRVIIADRAKAGAWEKFTILLFQDSLCAVLSYDNTYISIQSDEDDELISKKNLIENTETFQLINLEKDTVAFRTINGRYLSFNPATSKIVTASKEIGNREKFTLIDTP